MKKITIEINHKLTPLHEEMLLNTLKTYTTSLKSFWDDRSKKTFNIEIK